MIPAIAPNQDATCGLCGAKQSYMPGHEGHHWIPRSLGGTETILLCVRCHNATEGSQPWRIAVTPDGVYTMDHTGTIIATRYTPPPDFDEGAFVANLDAAAPDLERRASWFRWLSDDGLVAAGEALYRLHYTGWVVRARLFETAVSRSPYGTKSQKLKELAKLFSIGGSQAWNEVAALEVLDAHAEVVQHAGQVLSPDLLVLAGRQPDPEKALELLVDRRAANPHYSRITYAQELKAGKTSDDAPPAMHECECGHRHIDRRNL